MQHIQLGKTGVSISCLGLGTWGIGGSSSPDRSRDDEAVRALRLGIDLGMTFIDTAEIYARGHSEELVAQAIRGQRDKVFLATKVSSDNLAYDRVLDAANRSLKRLEVSCVDLYQVHWPNSRVPIVETMSAMEELVKQGKVRHIGVSNFSVRQTKEAKEALAKNELASNQVEYSLLDRSIEPDLLPYCQKEQVTIIAYSPLARGNIPKLRGGRSTILDEIAAKYGRTPVQVALNWLVAQLGVMAIPKAIKEAHVKENAGAADCKLAEEDRERLSLAFS